MHLFVRQAVRLTSLICYSHIAPPYRLHHIHTGSTVMSEQPTIATPATQAAVTANDSSASATLVENKGKKGKTPRPPRPPKQTLEKPPMKEYKVLMIHGYTQSGSLFRSKVRAVEKALLKTLNPLGITLAFLYPTAPIRLLPRDIPGWVPKDESDLGDEEVDSFGWFKFDEVTGRYLNFAAGASTLAAEMRAAGGVDIILGFSQGAFVASTMAAVLEKPWRNVPVPEHAAWAMELREANGDKEVKFAAVYSGFIAKDTELKWLYEEKVKTPSVHVLGGLDSIVDEARSTALVDRCENAQVYVHPGSHYVPVGREWLNAISAYFKKHLYDDLQPKKEETEDDA